MYISDMHLPEGSQPTGRELLLWGLRSVDCAVLSFCSSDAPAKAGSCGLVSLQRLWRVPASGSLLPVLLYYFEVIEIISCC